MTLHQEYLRDILAEIHLLESFTQDVKQHLIMTIALNML